MEIVNLIVDETARIGLDHYLNQGQTAETLIAYHRQHINATMDGAAVADGGLFLTDIPDTDLTVLEVRLGAKGSMALYSRKEASEIAGLILEILGAYSDTHH